jgi:hypothetical protein
MVVSRERNAGRDDSVKIDNSSTVKENAEDLVVATKEIGLEVNADKTKFMVRS